VPVAAGDTWEAGLLWNALLDAGVYTNFAMPPAVPKPILRTSVMATHSPADIDRALDGFERARAAREVRGQPSGR
jgi:7-keto-8-aminopelargonate synthetase-like enzyme